METRSSSAGARRVNGKPGKNTKRRRVGRLTRLLTAAFIVLLLALIAVFVVRLFVSKPNEQEISAELETGVFLPGVTVNGRDVSGMTFDEARALLYQDAEKSAAEINIRVVHGTTLWVLSAADMGAKSNLDIVLSEAILLGRQGSFVENKKVQEETEAQGHAYTAAFFPDEAKLAKKLAVIGAAIDTAPVDPAATPNAWESQPAFSYGEGHDGYMLDENALLQQITECLARGDYDATLEPTLELTGPAHTIDWVKEHTQLRATYQTSFGGSRSSRNANRVGNIQKATTILNGAVIEQGAQFDFNEYIGPRTEAGGWPLAPGIVNGDSYEMQAGGGICQVSTTLYISLLLAEGNIAEDFELNAEDPASTDLGDMPILINERHHHSWPSSYADRGLDATVSTGGKNLRFINNTGAPMYIFAYCDQENYLMTIYIYGTPLEAGVSYAVRGDTVETIEPDPPVTEENPNWPVGYEEATVTARKGYVAKVYRIKTVNGEEQEPVLLYTDKYRAVQGKKTIGTGAATLPKPGE